MRQEDLSELLPYTSHFVEIDGYKMHYLDEGAGPVVLLLHGNPTWCFYYRNLISALKEKFRVIACDYIGCGLSDHPQDVHFTAEERVEQLGKFIEKLSLSYFSLVMHDWGGSIGTLYAIRNMTRIERLVYLNTTLTDTEDLPPLIKKAANPKWGGFFTQYTKWFLRITTAKGLGVVNKLPRKVREAYFYPYQTIASRTAIKDFVDDIPFDESYPSYKGLREISEHIGRLAKIPVQIVWGMQDPCFHKVMMQKVADLFPQASILEIPDASHLVLEDAAQVSCEVIRKFLMASPYFSADDDTSGVNIIYKNFMEQVEKKPESEAIMIPSFSGNKFTCKKVTYEALNGLINQYQRGLSQAGLHAGDKVVMLVSPGVDFLALSYAVAGRAAIPIFLDPGMGIDKLISCIETANPAGFIVSPKAHLLRLKKPKLFSRAKFCLTVGGLFGLTTSSMKKYAAIQMPEVTSTGTALIAYTSGATGAPKGVVYTDVMMAEQLRIFKDIFGFTSDNGEKDLPLLPVFSLFTVALGVCSVFPPVDPAKPLTLDAAKIVSLINELKITYSFGSPALWNKISSYCVDHQMRLPSLKKIFMAGAPVQRETLERLKTLLDDGDATTPYGATEALPVTLISMDEILNTVPKPAASGAQGVLVGHQVGNMRLGVIEAVDEALEDISAVKWLPSYQIGEVIVSGRNVSPAYFEKPEATRLAKIKDGNVFWHRMGDMGYLDDEGNLYFCGRKAHAVHANGKVYYSVPTEKIFNAHPKVARSALVALKSSQGVGIVIEPLAECWNECVKNRDEFINELLELAKSSPLTADIQDFFFYRSFPVDGRHNAKIFRDQLAEWADKEKQNAEKVHTKED